MANQPARIRLPQPLTVPLAAGLHPIAARIEIVANDCRQNGNKNVLITGCIILDESGGIWAIPEGEWCGHLAVTTAQMPLAPDFDGPLREDTVDRLDIGDSY